MEEEFPISSVTVEITTRIDTHDDRELSTSFSGTINVMDDDGEDVCIGKIKMDRLEVYEAKLHKGRCVIDAADEISQPMYDAAEACFRNPDDDWFNADVLEAIPGAVDIGNMLLIESLFLDPKYRGRNIAAHAVKHCVEALTKDTAIVVCHPFPTEGVERNESYEVVNTQEFMRAIDSLQKFWKGLGFEKLGDTDFVARDSTNLSQA
jgi:GNAT superfamily N-acetyltransferase